jgi:predicted ArsR family transcriptional regulator
MSRRAKMLFPSRDGELMGSLLQFLREHGAEELVETFFEDYWDARTQAVKQKLREAAADDLEEKLEVLRSILEAEGFMPEISRRGGRVTIRECNCPFPESVKQTKLPCRLERAFFEALFGSALDRVSYIPEGNAACTYEIAEGEIAASTGDA